MSETHEPRVFLVGAGPGAPGLLTLRAVELLASADIVIYDQLVPRRLLDFANPKAETVCVRELPGNHPDKYPHIHNMLIDNARAGKRVVRLKGGDPLIFGRGGEEAETLRAAGIPYEIVPGVTAALAAAAFLDLPLTHRNYSSAVALVTGHELPTKPGNRLDWKALAQFPGTLAIYMGIARLPLLVDQLVKHGRDPESPAAIVERVSTGDMRTVAATLGTLDDARRNAGLESPGLILIGEAVGRRVEQSWFQQRPLFGQRVLVTRPRHQAEAMIRRLEVLGAVPYQLPTVEIREPENPAAVDTALTQIRNGEWDWLVFSSANGVHSLIKHHLAQGRDVRDFAQVKFATVGPKTAAALKEYHLQPDLVPPAKFSAEHLAEHLGPHVQGKRVLLARGKQGRPVLAEQLAKVATVSEVVVYEQADAIEGQHEVFDALRRGEIRYVTLTSPNIARALAKLFDDTIRGRVERGEIRLVAISPLTAAALDEFGLAPAAVAAEATTDGLIAELIRLTKERGDDH
ncbi:uroporphyrinogen-III C-methyltransferase [Limnoglobus roseus]|uniref:uroporphyrinogen-III C-methyltransferase n=1 Tax=Limnoglobus roseus TaxID=2598579 RepID=A0A5C1A9A5_9BACT|nr:uroporphyrinogen-III C-methyltransferase [Limnoglobus roseus]QEL15949.1 uroporphyrinogen-III C-methyltransferase [Limnoglobus roseus]